VASFDAFEPASLNAICVAEPPELPTDPQPTIVMGMLMLRSCWFALATESAPWFVFAF